MKFITLAAASAALAFAAIPIASPAMAQGTVGPTPATGQRVCPSGYAANTSNGRSDKICYPNSGARPVYPRESGEKCADGYEVDKNWCIESSRSKSSGSSSGATYTDPTFGNLTKAHEYDRCPVGYHTSDSARTTCVSYHQGKSPASRLKKGGACAADEVDEWGLWCTSKTTSLTRAQAEDEAISDVNIIFAPEARGATQGPEYENTPGIVAIFGRKGGASASNASASSSESDPSATPIVTCQTDSGSATGAAIGGALGGDTGAVIGGMLGGRGKKKKKGC